MKEFVKLEDIADVIMGQSPKSEYYTDDVSHIPFLQGNRTFGYKYPTYDTYCTKPNKIGTAGSVIMSVRAPVGDLNILQEDTCLGRGVCAFIPKGITSELLFYILKANTRKLTRSGNGTIFNSIGRDELLSMVIQIPENPDEFVKKLSSLDKKIELNNSIILNCEKLLDLLYKKYFILENTKVVRALNELAAIVSDTVNPSNYADKVFKYYDIPTFDETGSYMLEQGKNIKSNKHIVPNNALLVSKLNPWFKRIAAPVKSEDIVISSTEFIVWKPINYKYLPLLYTVSKTDAFTKYLTKAASGTSNSHKRVKPQYMLEYKLQNFKEENVDTFNKYAFPLLQQIQLLIDENVSLKDIVSKYHYQYLNN